MIDLPDPGETPILRLNDPLPSDMVPFFTREQAKGAIPNETIIEKCNSVPDDTHVDGDLGVVLGSIGPAPHPGTGLPMYGYFVAWRSHPDKPCFVAGFRLRKREIKFL